MKKIFFSFLFVMFSLSPVMADTIFIHSGTNNVAKMLTPSVYLISTYSEFGTKWIALMDVGEEKDDLVISKMPLKNVNTCSNYIVGGKYGVGKKTDIVVTEEPFSQPAAFKCFCDINQSVLEGDFYVSADGEDAYSCEGGQVITKKHVKNKKNSVIVPVTL